ncbi:klp1 [Symbiodinium natans]|uniref:Klp1 protein n=1 Tax=Symbiodinium natans TaxID=878477 RepID=A0A812NIU6_9DINO|nr:klp1 [Symbiodinium natans]
MAHRAVHRIDVDPSGALVLCYDAEGIADRQSTVIKVPVAELHGQNLEALANTVLLRVPDGLHVSVDALCMALGELRAACAGEAGEAAPVTSPADSAAPPPRAEAAAVAEAPPSDEGSNALWVRAMDGTRYGPFNVVALRSARKLKLQLAERLQISPMGIALLDSARPVPDEADLQALGSTELQLLRLSTRPAIVVARVRPMNRRELQADETVAVAVVDEEPGRQAPLRVTDAKGKEHLFTFDYTFPPSTLQKEVCQAVAPAVEDALEGISSTFVTYGARGAGKSFTLRGSLQLSGEPGPGWILDFSDRLLAKLQEGASPYLVGVSMLSAYHEELTDLLVAGREKLRVRRGADGVEVPDLSWHVAESTEEILELLQAGLNSIQVACTNMEIESGEVTSIFQLHISRWAGEQVASATIRFVDSANSDRPTNPARRSKYLEALREVVDACGRPTGFIPYRFSKLTQLLQPALCGPTPLVLLAACSPAQSDVDETLRTLQFASKVQKVTNFPKQNLLPAEDFERLATAAGGDAWISAVAAFVRRGG